MATLRLTLQSNKASQALIAATVRNEETLELFLCEVKRVGLHVEEMALDDVRERHFVDMHGSQPDSEASQVKIYKIS